LVVNLNFYLTVIMTSDNNLCKTMDVTEIIVFMIAGETMTS